MNKKYQPSDWQSLDYHSLIADKLRQDPKLIQKALENIQRWKEHNPNQPYLDEWKTIIDSGLEPLTSFMLSETNEAQRLRSSSPFAGVLTQSERMEIWKKYHPKT